MNAILSIMFLDVSTQLRVIIKRAAGICLFIYVLCLYDELDAYNIYYGATVLILT